jgi:O-antigen/teichoic acid export membrane protein
MTGPGGQSPKASVGQGAFWSIVNNGLTQFLSLAVFLVTARFVSTEAFGIMAVCFLIIETFRQIAVESIGTAVTAKTRPTDKDYNAAFLLILGIGLAGAGAMYVTAPLIARMLDQAALEHALQMTSILLVTTGLSRTHESWLSVHMQFKSLAVRSLLSICCGGAVGIYMAVQGYGLLSLIAQQLTTAVIGLLFLWTSTSWRPGLSTDRQSVKDLWGNARHLGLTGLANFVNGQSDTFFAIHYLGIHATGIYNAAKRIVFALNAVLSNALGRVALPAFADMQDNPERLRFNFLRIVGYTSMITAPLFAGIAVLAPEMVHLLLGPRWAETAPIISILCVATYLATLTQYTQSIFFVCRKAHWQSTLSFVHAGVNIVLYFLFAKYGLVALALAYSTRAAVLIPFSMYAALRLIGAKAGRLLKKILPSIGAAAIMFACLWHLKTYVDAGALMRAVVLVPLGGVIYAAALCVLDFPAVKDLVHMARASFAKR